MSQLFRSLFILGCLLFSFQGPSFSQEMEMDNAQQVDVDTDFERGIDAVAEQGNESGWDSFERWGAAIFGQRTIDPLAGHEEAQRAQNINEGAGERAEMAAEFTDAATTVATAGMPSPGGASGAVAGGASYAIGEGAETIAEEGASDEEPGVLTQIYNWFASWFD